MKKPVVVEPWKPADYEDADTHALKALARGDASADQQKRALDWIIYQAARTYDMSYRPASDRDTAFAEGMRHVGSQIVKQINLPLTQIAKAKQEMKNARS